MAARFSIGIDLGTTNSALAFVALDGDARPEALLVPQLETPVSLGEATTLPSFLYLPEDAGDAATPGADFDTDEWIVGRLARRRAGETPGRVARSAKSWLCHHSADRTAPILPWGSEDLSPSQKISPVGASALVLAHLRAAWNSRFARQGFPFDAQDIAITVPASFDAAAQRLTLDAAQEAGFPPALRLLEEPQAAFYCWLEAHDAGGAPWGDASAAEPRHILIVDIGGGTSDFSLFETRAGAAGATPEIKRVAVSDHILLGGDNMDLALAALVEPRLAAGRGGLSGPQWDHLVASCRDIKELALAGDGSAPEHYVVALPGRGSGLIGGAQATTVQRDEVERMALDGFFPECDARAKPWRTQSGLRDWGLPYAADSAITRHLADFLADRPRVDAVLFNGGALHAGVLRQRLLDQIAAWQEGVRPVELFNAEPDLAVARGAARFGKLLHARSGRIAAGAARAVFLAAETAAAGERPALICVLPLGAAAEQGFAIDLPGLELRTGRPVSFQAWSSTRHGDSRPGDVVPWDPDAFQALPELQTRVETGQGADAGPERTVPVRLAAKINALGLLQIACVGTDPRAPGSWPLEFNLRAHETGGRGARAAEAVAPNATPEAQQAVREQIAALFAPPPPKAGPKPGGKAGGRPGAKMSGFRPVDKSAGPSANAALKTMERVVGAPRHEWNAALLRGLWPALDDATAGRKHSVEHEEAWLGLAGFLLRPGFGYPGDAERMDALWRLRETGLAFPGKRSKVQEAILWRRVAGGLTAERQDLLLAADLATLAAGKASPELVRLAGSLERLPRETKTELIELFLAQAIRLIEGRQHCAPHLSALGLLLNRTPLYAGPESVVAPELVERAFAALQPFDWSAGDLTECCTLFLRAARVVDDRNLDVPRGMRDRIARKLEGAGVTPLRAATIRAFTPGRADRAALYGEPLPPGLVLGGDLG
ncbi:Hsp70 protein [Roseiarcus fermentans]|uniref:Hsp70 protein n=1 Tax=Roseiarcus fermentans TaxID=1473586 RepID=A0A366FQC9_9HYPH|nr:hsp70 family protein [Roseiarcus fermentans]RBP16852.1 Hsp70 protein [Roseiarcus fermentans]